MIKLSGRGGLKYRMLPMIHLGFRLIGRRWTDFYAWLLNYQERSTKMTDILSRYSRDVKQGPGREKGLYDVSVGTLYVDLLKDQGLKPTNRILDFGCGYGRVAIPLLPYLEPGKYVGLDLSAERVRLAEEYVEIEKLEDRQPEFHVSNRQNTFEYLGDRKFDVIWARAVLGHMPFEDMRKCLAGLKPLLAPGGVFIGDFDAAEGDESSVVKFNVKTFQVPPGMMKEMVVELGYEYDEIPDWERYIAPDEPRTYIRMMRLAVADEPRSGAV